MVQGPTDLRQIRLIDVKTELQPIANSSDVDCFPSDANLPLAVAGERKGDLPLHGGKAGRTLHRSAQTFHFLQERVKFLGPQISTEATSEAASHDLKFAIDPVSVRIVEEAGMATKKRPDQYVICT